MSFSLSFVVVLVLVLFPGLLFRRLYYYGEFSKQFMCGLNLISLIAISIIPGIIISFSVLVFYDQFISSIDLGFIFDSFKDLNNPLHKYSSTEGTPIKELLKNDATPFIAFIYTTSVLLGLLSGRFVRISRLDTRIKLLRFKNYWFYLFKGQQTLFKKMKHDKQKNRKHLFTKADILIDSNNKTLLYSGIIRDYELEEKNCRALSKVILQNAKRYSFKNDKTVPVDIPGNLFVVDCSNMKNINLTFIYKKTKTILESKTPVYVEIIIQSLILLLIPFFLFQADSITLEIYQDLFSFSWIKKFVAYLFIVFSLILFNPFIRVEKEKRYKCVTVKTFIFKLILASIFGLILWVL